MPDKVLKFEQFTDEAEPGITVLDVTHGSVGEHSHNFYELVYVKNGFCLHETEKATTLLIEGDFFLLQPGIRHRYVGSHTVELINCIFVSKAISEQLHELNAFFKHEGLLSGDFLTPIPKLHLDIYEQKHVLRTIKSMLFELSEKREGWQLKVKCHLLCLLIDFLRGYEKRIVPNGDREMYPNYVLRALMVINQEYANPLLTVAGIAKHAKVSADYLSRQFRMLTGVGVQEYLRRFRFAKATELLTSGLQVGEVSEKVGFSSLCHFSREFKKEMGVSPTQYVKRNN